MRVLLTGATGFVGSHVLLALCKAGHDIVAVKRSTSIVPVWIRDVGCVSWYDNDENLHSTLESLGRFDVVVHIATNYGGKSSNWVEIENDNVGFPLSLLQFSISNGCRLFINTDTFFSREGYSYAHMEEYILTKQYFSRWGMLATRKNSDVIFVNARLEHVYGPRDGSEKFLSWLLRNFIADKDALELTTCDQKRDFIYIDDVVAAYMSIIDNADKLKGYCEVGIGAGNSVPLKDFVLVAKDIAGAKTSLLFGAVRHRQGEIMYSQADLTTLKSFGWEAKVGLAEGIKRTFNELICSKS